MLPKAPSGTDIETSQQAPLITESFQAPNNSIIKWTFSQWLDSLSIFKISQLFADNINFGNTL